jgi:hypothetical protein
MPVFQVPAVYRDMLRVPFSVGTKFLEPSKFRTGGLVQVLSVASRSHQLVTVEPASERKELLSNGRLLSQCLSLRQDLT